MRKSRALIGVTSLALAATSVLASSSIAAADETAPTATVASDRGTSSSSSAVPQTAQAKLFRAAAETLVAGDPIEMPTSYPYQPRLPLYRDNPDDAAHRAELLGHPDLAPKLQELMAASDRVSVQVVGQSTQGRDLYLVTVTAPETEAETARQAAWKGTIKDEPTAAAADATLLSQYKTPVWISNNIHGNEWEGTDAAMKYIEWLATAPLSEVGSLLRNNRLYFSPSLNPDGRTNATRATALGLDPNRDMITNATPETKSYIRQAQAIQPIYTADFHGYTGVLQIEPCGPPHGTNYEYDLSIPHNYALALKVEQDVVAAAIPGNPLTSAGGIAIPYRDDPNGGWDDYPPVFSAQYAAFYGAATSTVELPLGRTGSYMTPARAVTNVAVAYETMESIVEYMNNPTSAREMLGNQIETFRRGLSGEPKKQLTVADVNTVPGPTQWRALWDEVDDQEPLVLPNAYVIPRGDGQRSESDAAALVEQLLLHDIEVGTLDAAATVGGKTYPAGSYVVDLDQPLRGMANSLLDLGDNISASTIPQLYADGAWSYSYLWGATVDKVGVVQDAPIGATTPVSAASSNAAVPAAADYVTFDLAGVGDFEALNALLEEGVAVSMLADGSAVVDKAAFAAVAAVSEEFDIAFEPATDADLDALDDATTKPLKDLKIAFVGSVDDRLALGQLGFDDLVQVTAASINANPALLADVDVLWIGSTFTTTGDSNAPVRGAVQALLDRGGALTGRAAAGFNAARDFGLMTGTAVTGASSNTALVDVDNTAGGVLAPYAQDTSYIYPATWFTGLGAGVSVEQTYGPGNPVLAGLWRSTNATSGALLATRPEVAATQASVVSSVTPRTNPAVSAKSIVFGTSVFFRTNPKSLFSQAARGIFWAAPAASERLTAPSETTVSIAPVAKVTYPGAAKVAVTASTDGTVELVSGSKVLASGTTTAGKATLSVAGLKPGSTSLVARFTPSAAGFDPSVSAPVTVSVAKASSTLKLSAKKVKVAKKAKLGKARVTITFTVPNVPGNAKIVLTDNGKALGVVTVAPGKAKTITVRLRKGSHTLRATYTGSSLVSASSASAKVKLS